MHPNTLPNTLPHGGLLIMDWGIGGLGAYKAVRQQRPDLDIIYLSDAGQVPYGKMQHDELQARLQLIFNWAAQCGLSGVLVACNAASTALPRCTLPITGVITPALNLIKTWPKQHLGIIGGQRTIDSMAYETPLVDAGFTVSARVAQPLSALIEAGSHHDDDARPAFEAVLNGLDSVDTLVLACTHYIASVKLISSIVPNVQCFDPVEACVQLATTAWSLPEGQGRTHFMTTGPVEQMIRSAELAFDVQIAQVYS